MDARVERGARRTRAAANRWFEAAREKLHTADSRLAASCIWGFTAVSLRATRFVKHLLIKRNEFFS